MLATVVNAQLGPCATPIGPDLPDLIVDRKALRAEKILSDEFIETNDCQLVEGCVGGSGVRQLLRFTTLTPNIGATDLVVGAPTNCVLLFHFSECHGHYHFEQYADYRLWTRRGHRLWRRQREHREPASSAHNAGLLERLAASGDLMAGHKQGFCMRDSLPYSDPAPPLRFNDCDNNQGLSAGWADWYPSFLDCQFIDVTGLAPGRYILEVEVNPDRVLPEASYLNNAATAKVRVPR